MSDCFLSARITVYWEYCLINKSIGHGTIFPKKKDSDGKVAENVIDCRKMNYLYILYERFDGDKI